MNEKRLLMCAPDYYEVAYEINAWMSIERRVDHAAAVRQWRAYYDLLTGKLGIKVELIDPVKGLPDMVFTANAGLVHKKMFIRSSFRFRERRGEEAHFENWFKKSGYQIKTIDKPFFFEGEGDALAMNGDLYTGYHFRSDLQAHDQVSGYTKTPYFALELCMEHYYHLDTCFAPVDQSCALVFMPAFETCTQMILTENIPDLIEAPADEAKKFACNALVAGKGVVMPAGCPVTAAALEKRGYRVHALDFSEFIKAGGAAKCLALWI